MNPNFSLKKIISLGAIACAALLPVTQAAAQKVEFRGQAHPGDRALRSGRRFGRLYPRAPAASSRNTCRASRRIIVLNVPGSRSIPGANRFQERASSRRHPCHGDLGHHGRQLRVRTLEGQIRSGQVDSGAAVAARRGGLCAPRARAEEVPRTSPSSRASAGLRRAKRELRRVARTVISFELLGLKPKYVWGMNRGPVRLAFERGELNINYDSMPGYQGAASKLVKAGKAVPLYSMGITDEKGHAGSRSERRPSCRMSARPTS
jgi:hypothetical protein